LGSDSIELKALNDRLNHLEFELPTLLLQCHYLRERHL
jgi:hypothetical protein